MLNLRFWNDPIGSMGLSENTPPIIPPPNPPGAELFMNKGGAESG